MIISIFWFLFTINGFLIKLTTSQKTEEANLKILKWVPLGFSAFIFIGLTVGISINKFYSTNFCLMNPQDSLCYSVETSCFKKSANSESVFTSDFGFGKLLVITSTMKDDLGIRYKIFDM